MSTLGGAPNAGRAKFVLQTVFTHHEGKYLSAFTKTFAFFSTPPKRFIKVLPDGVAPTFASGALPARKHKAPNECEDHLLDARPEMKKRKCCSTKEDLAVISFDTSTIAAISADRDATIHAQASEIVRLSAAESASAERIANLEANLRASENARDSAETVHAEEISHLSTAASISATRIKDLEAKLLASEAARDSAKNGQKMATSRADEAERSAKNTLDEAKRNVNDANAAAVKAAAAEIERYTSTISEQDVAITGHKERESQLQQRVEQLVAANEALTDERDHAITTRTEAINSMQSERESRPDVEMLEEESDQQLSAHDNCAASSAQVIESNDDMEIESHGAFLETCTQSSDRQATINDLDDATAALAKLTAEFELFKQQAKADAAEALEKSQDEMMSYLEMAQAAVDEDELSAKLDMAEAAVDQNAEDEAVVTQKYLTRAAEIQVKNAEIQAKNAEIQAKNTELSIAHHKKEMRNIDYIVEWAAYQKNFPTPPSITQAVHAHRRQANARAPITLARSQAGRIARSRRSMKQDNAAFNVAVAVRREAEKQKRDEARPEDLLAGMAINCKSEGAPSTTPCTVFQEDDGDDDEMAVDSSINMKQKSLEEERHEREQAAAEQKKLEEQQRQADLEKSRKEVLRTMGPEFYGVEPFPNLNAIFDEQNEKRAVEVPALFAENCRRYDEKKLRDSGYGSQEGEQRQDECETGQNFVQAMDFDQDVVANTAIDNDATAPEIPDRIDPTEQTPEQYDVPNTAAMDKAFDNFASRIQDIKLMKDAHLHKSEIASGDTNVPTNPLASTDTSSLVQAAKNSAVTGAVESQKMTDKVNETNAGVAPQTDFSENGVGKNVSEVKPKGKRVTFADCCKEE
jgi:V/A-type H+-transporting ATPase subunit G/H